MEVLCLADTDGIKGFDIDKDQLVFAKLRAEKEHDDKYSILFKIDLTTSIMSEIREMLDKGLYKDALTFLKSHVKQTHKKPLFPKSLAEKFKISWHEIPGEF